LPQHALPGTGPVTPGNDMERRRMQIRREAMAQGAKVATRVKMRQSSNVFAVAMMADGKVLFAQKEIKVTLGGCGG
jgi:predicted secreted protein